MIADLLSSSVRKYPNNKAVCWRDQVRIIEEEKEVTKVRSSPCVSAALVLTRRALQKVDGEEVKEMKKWTFFEMSDYHSMTYAELGALVKAAGSALVETGHNKKTIFNIYASTSVHWQVMANGESPSRLSTPKLTLSFRRSLRFSGHHFRYCLRQSRI